MTHDVDRDAVTAEAVAPRPKPRSPWPREGGNGSLRTAFDAAALSLTVGAEEELLLVDGHTGRLVPIVEEVLEKMNGDERFHAEFRAAQIELVTRPYLSAGDIGRELAIARVELADALADRFRPIASGLHPTAESVGPITQGERYSDVASDNPLAALHLLTCGLHVHVALGDADRALAVHDALRSYLPEFAALAANSPFNASATGAASTRQLLNCLLARHGVPPAFRTWSRYEEFNAWGRNGGSIPDPSYHWWDLRLHPGYGTLEIRGCDAQTDVADAVALVGLAQTLVAWLAARYDAGEHLPVHSTHLISESLRIGARSGAGGELLDLETGERQPVTIRVRTLLDQLAPVAVELGTERELGRISLMASTGGADRQKAIVEERGQDGLVGWLASETLASAQMYLARARTS